MASGCDFSEESVTSKWQRTKERRVDVAWRESSSPAAVTLGLAQSHLSPLSQAINRLGE